MSRKRNINFGFLPAHPTRADLAKSRREFKGNVRRRRSELRAEYSRLRKSARSGRTQSTRKLEALFHEVYGPQENPRILPEMTGEQLAAIERLIGGKTMAQKKKRKRKGKMPAGLKAYWAKKRRAKAKRRNPPKKKRTRSRRRRPAVKRRRRSMAGRYDKRLLEVIRELKARKNPRRRKKRKSTARRRVKKTIRIKAPAGLGPKGLRQFRSMAARAYGMPARIVKK